MLYKYKNMYFVNIYKKSKLFVNLHILMVIRGLV